MAEGRRPLIAGNWKMNGLRADGTRLARAVADGARDGGGACELAVCPPFTLLADVGAAIRGSAVALGAQDCHAAAKGAHTGDIAAPMLADLGCRYVIVGHSERRQNHGEADAQVRAKAAAALTAGLDVILCVGETEAERDAGRTLAVVRGQLAGSLPPGIEARRLVVAYEPVWAIGTGRTASPSDVAAVHAEVRAALGQLVGGGRDVRILYGGSVKPDNAAALMALADVDGALVGGASLQADDFLAIARSCP